MNAGYFVSKWIKKLINRKGKRAATADLAGYVGAAIARKVVEYIVKGATTKAIAALGGKIGALAGPIGVGAGVLFGAL